MILKVSFDVNLKGKNPRTHNQDKKQQKKTEKIVEKSLTQ